jgi:hypothetical protein
MTSADLRLHGCQVLWRELGLIWQLMLGGKTGMGRPWRGTLISGHESQQLRERTSARHAQMGWHDRSMVDRYAADRQDQRALEAKRRRGDMY